MGIGQNFSPSSTRYHLSFEGLMSFLRQSKQYKYIMQRKITLS
jgi:hypothetical protein